jgi:hypothetical protein
MRRAFFLLILCASLAALSAHAQEVPAKLLQLETISPPAPATGSGWALATGETPLYVSGGDSARVYFANDGRDRVIIAKVAGVSWVRAGVFGWFPVNAVTLADYNAIQDAGREDWNYLNFHPFELAFTVALHRNDPLPAGAVKPRGMR